MMATLKVNTPNFTLESRWKCSLVNGGYKFDDNTPTWDTHAVTFQYNIPSGAEISRARVYATLGSAFTGISVCNVNGSIMKRLNSNVYYADVSVSGGFFAASFSFKANGNKINNQWQSGSLAFTNVYLQIDYEVLKPAKSMNSAVTSGLTVPPQSCCVYDPSNGKVYMFDGVIRIQHQSTMKIEEEPSNKKEEFINNARNEPDRVTLDVLMSDVYYGGSALDSSANISSAQSSARNATKNYIGMNESSRSANAFAILHDLKESRRRISVITPQYVHTDMIVNSIVANQDEANPYGWAGQIVFQHAFAAQAKGGGDNSDAAMGGAVTTDASFFTKLRLDPASRQTKKEVTVVTSNRVERVLMMTK